MGELYCPPDPTREFKKYRKEMLTVLCPTWEIRGFTKLNPRGRKRYYLCLPVCLYICSIWLSAQLSIWTFVCLYICIAVYLDPSIYIFARLYICFPVCTSIRFLACFKLSLVGLFPNKMSKFVIFSFSKRWNKVKR